jgi:serine/threonine kinase PknH
MLSLIRATKTLAVAGFAAAAALGVSVPAAAQPDADPANNDKLFAMLAGGYTPAHCVASKLSDAAIARLGCGPNGQPGAPSGAIYSLYPNVGEMNKAFDSLARSGDAVPCPGSNTAGPIPWGGGMVSCETLRGPAQGAPMVAWTRSGDLLVASARGQDIAALYNWWLNGR